MHTKTQDKIRMGNGVKNLTRKEAMKKYPYKKTMGDCRGFSYSPKSGKWEWV